MTTKVLNLTACEQQTYLCTGCTTVQQERRSGICYLHKFLRSRKALGQLSNQSVKIWSLHLNREMINSTICTIFLSVGPISALFHFLLVAVFPYCSLLARLWYRRKAPRRATLKARKVEKKHKCSHKESYSTYVCKVLKQVHPNTGIINS